MNIIVPLKQVPDLVEELQIDESGRDLNREWLKYKLNEFDEHALEEALLLKEELGGQVTAIALESEEIDKTLFTAAAKGADKLIKITGDFGATVSSRAAAKTLAVAIKNMPYDLILTGVQAADDRDGQLAGLLAHYLNLPHVSVVTGVKVANGRADVHKEYSGGVMAEFEVQLPAVLGIQAARETPRYAPVSRVRQAMKQTSIEEIPAGEISATVGSSVR
ncbi:MAG TPA: electron transfer flavoprotein subunit beta/FixA family protein, partial [Acidobacteriota bacterium]|nr:electron transfer flavoprotein subunit beta/FixA family protein [Acidobacteriota bacterium]